MDDVNIENTAMDATARDIREITASGNATQPLRNRGRGRPFPPGNNANPHGRPKGNREIGELARSHAPAAIAKLRELLDNRDPSVALSAARTLLDRAYGKAAQTINSTGSPLVSISMAQGGAIIDAASAAAAYAAICGNPNADISAIRFAPQGSAEVPAILEHLDDGKGGE